MRLHVDVHLCGFISPRKWLHLYNDLFHFSTKLYETKLYGDIFNGFDRMKTRIKKSVR